MTGFRLKGLRLFLLLACVPTFASAMTLEKLSTVLARGASSLPSKKVAVLILPYHDSRISSGSSIIAERLTTLLVGKKDIKMVERRLIQKLLEERKLSETGALDQETVKTMGSLLGVDAIVSGTLIDLENGKTEVNARMIDSESGEILAAGKADVDRTWTDRPRAPQPRAASIPKKTKPAVVVTEPVAEEEIEPALVVKPGKELKLSNESFPPGRRIYHSPNEGIFQKKPAKKGNAQPSTSPSYDEGYDEGYADAAEKNNSSPKKTVNASATDRSLNLNENQELSVADEHIADFRRSMRQQTRRGAKSRY